MTYYEARRRLTAMMEATMSPKDKEALETASRLLLTKMTDMVHPKHVIDDDVEYDCCPKCGVRFEGTENYCWSCGVELDWDR